MKKIIMIIILLSAIRAEYYDNRPDKFTKEDMEILKENEKLIYKEADFKIKHVDYNKIYMFLIKTKKIKEGYIPLKLTTSVTQKVGSDRGTSAEVTLSYNILDLKNRRELKNKEMQNNINLLKQIKAYFDVKIEKENIKRKIRILKVKYRIYKAEEFAGQRSREDRINILLTLEKEKENYMKILNELEYYKKYLLQLTTRPRELEKML